MSTLCVGFIANKLACINSDTSIRIFLSTVNPCYRGLLWEWGVGKGMLSVIADYRLELSIVLTPYCHHCLGAGSESKSPAHTLSSAGGEQR